MKVKAFLILMVVTVLTVVIAARYGEDWFAPGLERAVFIGIVTSLVVFPLSYFFERIGWVKGSWNIAGDKNTGDKNTGDKNTGDKKAGDRNAADASPSADARSGDSRSGDGDALVARDNAAADRRGSDRHD